MSVLSAFALSLFATMLATIVGIINNDPKLIPVVGLMITVFSILAYKVIA